jgi:hypothetical protein
MSAVRNTSLSDPLSLVGLEPLLDQIFGVQHEFAPDAPTQHSKTTGAHVDFYAAEVGRNESPDPVLTAQLNAVKAELKSYQYQYRHLALKLASQDDQLQYLPELFSKVLTHSAVQAENAELKRENAALLKTIEHMKPKVNQPSMGRRILNRFFGT